MEGYAVVLLKSVYVGSDRSKLGSEEGAGPVWLGGFVEGDSVGKLEDVVPGQVDILGISLGTEVGRREGPGSEVLDFGDAYRGKLGVEEISYLVYSDIYFDVINDDNLDSVVHVTEDSIIQGTDGKVMYITNGE